MRLNVLFLILQVVDAQIYLIRLQLFDLLLDRLQLQPRLDQLHGLTGRGQLDLLRSQLEVLFFELLDAGLVFLDLFP